MSETNMQNWAAQAAEKSLMAICLLAGIVGVTASKGMVLLLSIGGLTGFFWLLKNRKQAFPAPTFLSITLALLFFWAILSSFWSLNESGAFMLCLRLGLLCLAGFFLLNLSRNFDRQKITVFQNLFLVGFGFALTALSIGYAYAIVNETALWGNYFSDPLTTLNNGAVVVSLLLIPCILIMWRRFGPVVAIISFILVCAGLWFFSSGASLLSIGVGTIVFTLVHFLGRKAARAIAVAGLFLILAAPQVAENVINLPVTQELAETIPASAQHRLRMWEFVSVKIAESPYLGLGMDSSRHIPQDAFRLAPNMELMPLHPHDAALQVRLELGIPGILLGALFVFSLFLKATRTGLTGTEQALRTSVLCSYLGIGAVSYGVWQSWWIATAWILVVLVKIAPTTAFPEDRSQG